MSFFYYSFCGDTMKVKIFDESHEEDLEEDINNFIKEENPDIIDFNLVEFLFGNATMITRLVYIIVAIAAVMSLGILTKDLDK